MRIKEIYERRSEGGLFKQRCEVGSDFSILDLWACRLDRGKSIAMDAVAGAQPKTMSHARCAMAQEKLRAQTATERVGTDGGIRFKPLSPTGDSEKDQPDHGPR